MNIESVPSEAGPDLDGIEQGITNYEVEIATSRALHAPRNDGDQGRRTEDKGSVKVKVESAKPQCKV